MIFRNWVLQNFPFLEDDFDALTDYELFCKMVEYMKKSLEKVKSYQTELDIFSAKLDEFQHYFDNLDLQEEVDKKLDEMYENGQLAELVSQFLELQVAFTYNNVSDMVASENFINGSIAKTLGFYEVNDGGGATYLIRTITNEDTIDNIHLFAITNDDTLVAELKEYNKINILQLGAKTTEDATNIINYAITNFNEVIIPDKEFTVSNSLVLKSKLYLHGINENSAIYMSKTNNMPLLLAENKTNIKIENITFTNKESDTSSGVPINQIGYFEGTDYINFNNVRLIDTFSQGLVFKTCGYINIINCLFKDGGHSLCTFLTETHDILVDNSIFDTVKGTNSNPYLLNTGSNDYYTEVEYLSKNMTVQNSTFKNNPLWEGLESHGCSNFTAINNKIYNCLQGIHVYFDDRTITTTHDYKNITIKNNIIQNDNDVNLTRGIIVGGTTSYFINNVCIENNVIEGGNTTSSDCIYVLYTNYFNIKNNKISKFKYQAITVQYCTNGDIIDNYIYNPGTSGVAGIVLGSSAWLVKVDNNTINGNGKITRCVTTGNAKGLGIIGHNYCYNYTQYKYYAGTNNNTLINVTDNTTSRRLGCKGIYSVDENDFPVMYCTDSVIRSIAETSSAKATGTGGTNLITSENAINYLCVGQEIVISGGASGGSDLTTAINEFIGCNSFTIKDNLGSDVETADIITTASTWTVI